MMLDFFKTQVKSVNLVKSGPHKTSVTVKVDAASCQTSDTQVCVIAKKDVAHQSDKHMKITGPKGINPFKIVFSYKETVQNLNLGQPVEKKATLYFNAKEGKNFHSQGAITMSVIFTADQCTNIKDSLCTTPPYIDYNNGAGDEVDLPANADYQVHLQS